MTRKPVYAHDFASVPSQWVDLVVGQDWLADHVSIRKNEAVYHVSKELMEDASLFDLARLMRQPSWASQLQWAIEDRRLGRRIRRWWASQRFRLGEWVAGESLREDDE